MACPIHVCLQAGPLYKYKWWHPLADIEDNIKAKNPAAASASQLNQQLQKRFDQKHHRGTGHRVSPAVTAMELAGTDLYVAYKSGKVPRCHSPPGQLCLRCTVTAISRME